MAADVSKVFDIPYEESEIPTVLYEAMTTDSQIQPECDVIGNVLGLETEISVPEDIALSAGVTAVMDKKEDFSWTDIVNPVDESTQETEVYEEIDEEPIVIDTSFQEVKAYTMWVSDTFLNARSEPWTGSDDNIQGVLKPGKKVKVVGLRDDGWTVIYWKDQNLFVSSEWLTDTEPVIKTPEKATYNNSWTGAKLNAVAGIVKGPSGNETYYNLNMSRCVQVMKDKGYSGEYWVREDGCKMFGNYIMCAASLKIRPRGSLVESSLGTCIVVDTGGFVDYDPYRLDIATTW